MTLCNYIKSEYTDKNPKQFELGAMERLHVKDVPQQMNASDCGVFACKYADFLSRGKAFSFSQSHMAYYRRRMVLEIVSQKLMQ